MTDKFADQGGLNAQTYERRKALVAEQWAKYQETKDPECLAVVCRELPFFEHPEVGNEIANLLTQTAPISELFENLWMAYKQDKDPQWLISMMAFNVFEYTPIPTEVSQEFAKILSQLEPNSGYNSPRKYDRNMLICRIYGSLHNQEKLAKSHKTKASGEPAETEEFQFQLLAIRDTARNFSDLKRENIQKILQRYFDAKKHLKPKGGTT